MIKEIFKMEHQDDPDDPDTVRESPAASDPSPTVNVLKKQKTLFHFTGFSSSVGQHEQPIEYDRKRTAAKQVFCKICGDFFSHNGALVVHMKWKHPKSKDKKRSAGSTHIILWIGLF